MLKKIVLIHDPPLISPLFDYIGAATARVARVRTICTNFWESKMGPAQYCVAKY